MSASLSHQAVPLQTIGTTTAPPTARGWWLPLVLALAYTLLNAVKPIHIDDTTYYDFARQIAAHPADPYGFSLMYFNSYRPANQVLAPPLVPYWWAPAIWLFGSRPFLWKLWFFPFSAIFVFSVFALLRRFARGLEAPLLCLTVLSPLFLPSFNLMLDVPAEGLSLLALVVFMRAVDRDKRLLAILAGVIAALAIQAKYTGFLAPAVMLVYAAIRRRPSLWLAAAGTAALLFGLWESFIAARYGQSHFLLHAGDRLVSLRVEITLAVGLLTQLGGTMAVLGILGLAACGVPRWLVAAAGVAVAAAYACVAFDVFELATPVVWLPDTAPATEGDLLFGCMGLFVLGACLAAASSMLARNSCERRDTLFLAAWLAVELLAYFAVSPYPAARRVMGIAIPATLLVGRLAAQRWGAATHRGLAWSITLGGIALGGLFYVVDLQEAVDEKEAVAAAFELIGQRPPGTTIWHNSAWAVKFYAEQAGARQVSPEPGPPGKRSRSVHLRAGDLLLTADPPIPRVDVWFGDGTTELVADVPKGDAVPLATIDYYAGRAPLEHQAGPRVHVRVFRILADTALGGADN